MENAQNHRPGIPQDQLPAHRRVRGPVGPGVVVTLASLPLPAVSAVGRIASGADCLAVPPGIVIPVPAAVLPAWQPNGWTAGLALTVGAFIGVGAVVTPGTGDHPSSGTPVLIASAPAEPLALALAGVFVAGAMSVFRFGRPEEARV
ncbi:hypothetical protein ACFC4G_38445 [Streptomyces sp. NPDC056002]|uniref:hypothetical protein n=1 Tax=Streptomyces sp. NPDC056002 TaxID=3345675 RepID=UPI0035E1AD3C